MAHLVNYVYCFSFFVCSQMVVAHIGQVATAIDVAHDIGAHDVVFVVGVLSQSCRGRHRVHLCQVANVHRSVAVDVGRIAAAEDATSLGYIMSINVVASDFSELSGHIAARCTVNLVDVHCRVGIHLGRLTQSATKHLTDTGA